MLSLPDLKKYYEKLYSELRNYVWDFEAVESLAELEIAVYRRFPDSAEIRNKFNRLYAYASRPALEDEDLAEALENFKSIAESSDIFYSRIVQPKEV